jgi:formylmethanofuran dehydrogenase subunit B
MHASPTSNTTSKFGRNIKLTTELITPDEKKGMAEAWIRGKSAALDAAIAEAANLLAGSRLPVIAGLGTDVAGARAAIKLAQCLGGVIDHMHSEFLLRDLDVMREAGMMVTTPNEASLRADLLLLVGPGLIEAWPALPTRLFGKRRTVWLCPDTDVSAYQNIVAVGDDPFDLPVTLAALRARRAGRPVANPPVAMAIIDALVAELREARFGVAIWSAAQHDSLTIEMLCGLVKDLNEDTRFSGLPLATADNAAGVQQVTGWMTGFPLRTGFGRGLPEHDPWRFEASRLIDSGEADCALWISAYGTRPPAWKRDLPLVALTAEPDTPRAHVTIAVGRPGIDHNAVEHLPATATLAALSAGKSSTAMSVATVLGKITAALPAARPC